jgi:hypothetical protein
MSLEIIIPQAESFSVPKHCAHDLDGWNCLLKFVFIGDDVCLCSMDRCYDSGVTCDTNVSSPVTVRLKQSSTARTKSSLTTDGRPLRGSSCTFSRPSLKCLTHLLTIESLMACSPYTSQSWRWMSAETDYRPHFTCDGLLSFLEHCKYTGRCVNVGWFSANCVRAFPKNQQTLHSRTP